MLCLTKLCYAMLCYVMLRHVTLFCAVLRCAVLCCALPYHTKSDCTFATRPAPLPALRMFRLRVWHEAELHANNEGQHRLHAHPKGHGNAPGVFRASTVRARITRIFSEKLQEHLSWATRESFVSLVKFIGKALLCRPRREVESVAFPLVGVPLHPGIVLET